MYRLLTVFFLLFCSTAHADITTGLIVWINPTNATSPIADSSGNSHSMALTNSPTFTSSGPNGLGGLTFNGTNQSGTITYSSAFNSSVGTWSYWFKTTANTAGTHYAQMGIVDPSGSFNGMINYINGSDGSVDLNIQGASGGILGLGTGSGYNDGNWHNFVIIWNRTSGGNCAVYIDGVIQQIGNVPSSWSFNGSDDMKFAISTDSFWNIYPGSLANIRVYNRQLSAYDIHQLYTDPNGYAPGLKINL